MQPINIITSVFSCKVGVLLALRIINAVSMLILSIYCIVNDVTPLCLLFIPVLVLLEFVFYYGMGFWKNTSLVLLVSFTIYSLTYYFIVPSLEGSVFYSLNNEFSFLLVKQALVLLSIFTLFFHRLFMVSPPRTGHVIRYARDFEPKRNLLFVIIVSLFSWIFLFPFFMNFNAIITASSKLEIDKLMAGFPYIKQIVLSLYIVIFPIIISSLRRKRFCDISIFIFPVMCLVIMFFLGGRKEILIFLMFVIVSNELKLSDAKLFLLGLLMVLTILSLGIFRLGADRNGGENDFMNFFGEFFYSHSVLPFIITDPKLIAPNISSYFGVFLMFIPGFVLVDKPIPPSFEIAKSISYIFDGMGLGFNPLAEAYLTFGLFAPLGCMLVLVGLLFFFRELNRIFPYANFVFFSTIVNLVRFDLKSYLMETFVIILMIYLFSFLLKIKFNS